MKSILHLSLALSFSGAMSAAGDPATGKGVDLKASDGTKLAATYYASAEPGPGILLLHQCNRDRSSWNGLAPMLAEKGYHVLTMDYRGYGQSGGPRHLELPQDQQRAAGQKWPGDVDVAYEYLRSQPGVKGDVIGAGGASCGVNQSIQLSRRHPEVKSLVLLSGNTDRDGRKHLGVSKVPLLIAAADDDGGAVQYMAWVDASSGNPSNKFLHYAKGGHGTDMFQPHPELPGDIVAWYESTLSGKPAAVPAAARPRPDLPEIRFLVMMDEPGGPASVAGALAAERRKDPKSAALAPGFVNQLGYEAIASGDPKAGIAIMQVNTEGHPRSSNAWDSLGDAYLADGQRAKALEAAEKALALVDADTSETVEQRKLIRDSAQQKVTQLKGAAPASK